MLPFTKRPGKDESADVVTKESSSDRPRTIPPTAAATKASPGADRPRLAMPSISDEEMTCLMPSKALTGAVPLPAAGKPASKTVPPATAASKSAPTGKKRVAKKPQAVDDEDDHRTVVRPGLSAHGISLPKSAAQLGGATESASPAAVIKAHLEAARAAAATGAHPAVSASQSGAHAAQSGAHAAQSGAHGALPVQDDVSSFPGVEIGGSRPGVDLDDRPERTVALPPSMNMTPAPGVPSVHASSHGIPAPMQSQPQMHYSQMPPPMQSAPAMQPFVRQAAVPQPMASQPMMMGQPAHFAPQPMSSPHMDPPATVVTSSTRKPRGNRTIGWAAALMSVGLVVGLAAAAVATGRADHLVDTTASFVDPSRAGAPKAAAAPKDAPKDLAKDPSTAPVAPAPSGATPPSSGVVNTGDPVTVAATPVVDPATTAAPPTTPPATDPATTAAPPATTATPPATVAVAATAAAPPPPATVAAVTPKPAAPAKTTVAPAAPPPAATPKPEPKPAVAAKPPTPTPTPAPKGKGGSSEDDEMKKAAEALAKAQLENSL